jgi:hypothetical protein
MSFFKTLPNAFIGKSVGSVIAYTSRSGPSHDTQWIRDGYQQGYQQIVRALSKPRIDGGTILRHPYSTPNDSAGILRSASGLIMPATKPLDGADRHEIIM